MRVDETGEPSRTVTADRLLESAERAFLRAEFRLAVPLFRRFQNEFGTSADDTAVRSAVLRGALAARAGNWAEAVDSCPGTDELEAASTGIVHALAVGALRRLAEEGRHDEAGTAALAILLWAYLLEEDDPGGFRGLLTQRRGTPVSDELWEEARGLLARRVTDLMHALDVRAGRDALAAWETAWEAECAFPVVVPADAGIEGLIPMGDAAWHLLDQGRRPALLDAYTARHPDQGSWTAGSPEHRACADPLNRALAARGRERAGAGEWREALTDFSTATRLGRTLDAADRSAVLRAGKNVGRTNHGIGYTTLARIVGLELAHALLPRDGSLAAELAAVLVRQGRTVLGSDPVQSRRRFARALVVSPQDQDAQSGLDGLLRLDLVRVHSGTQPRDEIPLGAVEDLLRRDPAWAPARSWLKDHYTAQATAALSSGDTSTARAAARNALRYSGGEGPYGESVVSSLLVDLSIKLALASGTGSTRAELERRVDLLGTAVDIAGPDHGHAGETYGAAVLDLAEHLETSASPTAVIELFLRDRMRPGVNARFDQTVKAAYLRRAEARASEGDVGGAQRDRVCAQRIGAGLPDQGLLFGPAPGLPHDDFGQGALF
ncbi:hypothetical protein ACODT5_12235 [Streptomyces sp. 5.8]|uniref:hypothetical protein n=1 Tax=Streptomyces sp. 5.8 TaxID=3406571 RepID=UPI003BB4BCB8